jgi:hypothetical protein
MALTTFHLRLPQSMATRLAEFAHDFQQPRSAVVRDILAYVLARPHLYPEALSERLGVQHTSTPEQMAAAQDYLQSLAEYDPTADLGHDLLA